MEKTLTFLIRLLELWRNRESAKLFGAVRSSEWPRVRREHLKKFPTCAVCGKKEKLLAPLNVHHCTPFHIDKDKELLDSNLITLCPDHHLLMGHLMNFSSYNKDVREDSAILLEKINNRP